MQKTSLINTEPVILRILKTRAASMKQNQTYRNTVGRPGDCFIYIVSGNAVYTTKNGERFTLSSGSVLFIRQSETYSMTVQSADYTYIFVEFITSQAPFSVRNEHFPNVSKETEAAFRQLLEFNSKSSPTNKARLMATLYTILANLFSMSEKQTPPHTCSAQIKRVTYEIERRFSNPAFSISSLSKTVGLSQSYLRKLFCTQMQITPVQYLTKQRISHAKNLLTYKEWPVSQIAQQCGFSDIYYFDRIFKKHTGMTPGEYRKATHSY